MSLKPHFIFDWQVKETFEDINTGLVADFMNCGGEQILLVRSKEAEACPSEWCRFILIDYFSCRSVQQNTGVSGQIFG